LSKRALLPIGPMQRHEHRCEQQCPQSVEQLTRIRHVCFTPKSRHVQRKTRCPLWANSGPFESLHYRRRRVLRTFEKLKRRNDAPHRANAEPITPTGLLFPPIGAICHGRDALGNLDLRCPRQRSSPRMNWSSSERVSSPHRRSRPERRLSAARSAAQLLTLRSRSIKVTFASSALRLNRPCP